MNPRPTPNIDAIGTKRTRDLALEPYSPDEQRMVDIMREADVLDELGPFFPVDPIGFVTVSFFHVTAAAGRIAGRLEEYGILDHDEMAFDTILDYVGALRAERVTRLETAPWSNGGVVIDPDVAERLARVE